MSKTLLRSAVLNLRKCPCVLAGTKITRAKSRKVLLLKIPKEFIKHEYFKDFDAY